MAYFATRRYNYWGQLGILLVFLGGSFIVGGVLSLIPLLQRIPLSTLMTGGSGLMDKLLTPENATALRWNQFISTLFLFFLSSVFYAWVCHKRPFKHLGFAHYLDLKNAFLVLLIMMACLPVVGALQELTEMLPWSPGMRHTFKLAEDDYNRQVAIIARMDNFNDYIISIIMIAFLPAVFEETFFRGAVQNWLSRLTKKPYVAIILTAIVFSAVHGSYLGFLSRFALGAVLGWIYYRTGNIWLNIVGHFFNNAFAVTALYKISKATHKVDPSKIDEHYPIWVGLIGLVALFGLYKLFEEVNKHASYRPGEEVIMPGYEHIDNIFLDAEMNQSENK